MQCEAIIFDTYTYMYKWRRKGSRTMAIIGVRAEEEETWEMGVKEAVYIYSVYSVMGLVIGIHLMQQIFELII